MALVFPFALSFLNDLIGQGDVSWDLRRNQELSGSGDGRFWAAVLSRPLWTVNITLGQAYAPYAREIDAKIRALGEGREAFLFEDDSYWPAAGLHPGLGATVLDFGADRTTIRLQALSTGYKIHPGDRFSAIFGGRYYFGEFVEGTNTVPADIDAVRPTVEAATGTLTTPFLAINPPLPLSATIGTPVELFRPVLRAQIPPGGYKAFTASRMRLRTGAVLSIMQKV